MAGCGGSGRLKQDLYQRAKIAFHELVGLNADDQNAALSRLAADDTELAKEVRTLLEYHTAQSLVVQPAPKRIQARGSLTTKSSTSAVKIIFSRDPWRMLLIGLPLLSLVWLLTTWIANDLRSSLDRMIATQLNHLIEDQRDKFHVWESEKLRQASAWAESPRVAQAILELVKIAEQHRPDAPELAENMKRAPHVDELQTALEQMAERPIKFAVWDRRLLTLADWNQKNQPNILAEGATADGAAMLTPVMNGQKMMFLPKLGKRVTQAYVMETRAPVVAIFLPVQDAMGSVVAALMVRDYGLEEEFAALTELPSQYATLDSYMLSREGVMLTPSKRAEDLKRAEMSVDSVFGESDQTFVRDPGVDLRQHLAGSQTKDPTTWQPTLLASQVAAGNDGFSVSEYRNYLGIPVVGAWRWDKDYEVGIAIEQDFVMAYAPFLKVQRSLGWLLSACGIALLAAALFSAWLQHRQRSAKSMREVGPYRIRELLGEGGMGRVYLAEHVLMRRPTAIKVLRADPSDPSSLTRFEREVQLACQLTHPNTISIYDFGRTTSGIFYYSMEYIQGAHLGQLLEYAGPIPAGRCIHILRQLCRALREAHQEGLVHRDIKPQNVMIGNRGGEADFIKLLDYGLVKAFAPGVDESTLQTKVVVGTPRFMAPERMASPWLADPRVDIYSVGALAYFLLTGQLPPLYSGVRETGVDALPGETVELPANVTQFGQLLSNCMATNPALRPASISTVLQQLDDLSVAHPWRPGDATSWWKRHETKLLELVKEKRDRLAARD